MNKKIAIGVGIVIAIALLAIFAMQNKGKNETKDQTSQTQSQTSTEQPQDTQTSLKSLLGMNQAQTCTYTVGENLGTSTFYVSIGKMRGDTVVKTGQTETTSHMIVTDQISYMWMDGQTTGYKMDFSALQENTTKGEVNNTGGTSIDPNKNFNFKCSPWSPDESKFSLPNGIEFTDATKMLQGTTTPPANPNGSNMATLCDSLQEPAKTECVKALQTK